MRPCRLTASLFFFVINYVFCEKNFFVTHSEDYYECYECGICDGSKDKPFGSILEGIYEGFASAENVYLNLLDWEYYLEEEEITRYLANKKMSSLNISQDPEKISDFVLRGESPDPTKQSEGRKKIIFAGSLLTLEIFKSPLRIWDIDLVFDWATDKTYTDENFIKISDANQQLSTLEFINVSFFFEPLIKAFARSKSLILIKNPNSKILFQNSSFEISSFVNRPFNAFIQTSFYPHYEYKPNISFWRSTFHSSPQSKSILSLMNGVIFELRETLFKSDCTGWSFQIDRSVVDISNTIIQRDNQLAPPEESLGLLILNYSNIQVTKLSLIGSNNEKLNKALFNYRVCNFLENNNATLTNSSFYNISFEKVLDFDYGNAFLAKNIKTDSVYGAVIYLSESNMLDIVESNFSNNEMTSVLHLGKANTLHMAFCSFIRNSKQSTGVSGAAIRAEASNSDIQIKGSNFAENLADYGAAIQFGTNNWNIIMENCSFSLNMARIHGGTLHLSSNNSNITIISSIFDSNSARYYGGTIYFGESNQFISFSSINSLSSNAGNHGGSIYFNRLNENITILDSNFLKNSAGNNGGTFLFNQRNQKILVVSSNFYGNLAKSEGGALYFSFGNTNISIYNSNFNKNIASYKGGSCEFNQLNANILIILSSFLASTATDGGGLYFGFSNSFISLHKLILEKNTAEFGGAIYFNYLTKNISLSISSVQNNMAKYFGGAFYFFHLNTNLTILSSTFEANTAFQDGGCFSFERENSNILFVSTVFEENKAETKGGVMMFQRRNSNITLFSSLFLKNYANTDGGALCLSYLNSNVSLLVLTFEENSALGNGGVISILNENKNFILSFNAFVSNQAQNGGAIQIETMNSNISIASTCFLKNIGETLGGAFYFSESNDLISLTNMSFFSNSAYQGGILYSFSSNKNIFFRFCKFLETKADHGTIVFSERNNALDFNRSVFLNMNYSNSVFRMGPKDELKIEFSSFDEFYPAFPNLPILLLSGKNNSVFILNSIFRHVVDYFLNDNSENSVININMTQIIFEATFSHEELFYFKAENADIRFSFNRIIISAVPDNRYIMCLFSQKVLKLLVKGIEFDFPDKVSVLLRIMNPRITSLALANIVLRKFSGSLVDVHASFYNQLNLSIVYSYLLLNNSHSVGHFLRLTNFVTIDIQTTIFNLTKNQILSFLIIEGDSIESRVTVKHSEFSSASAQNDYFLEKDGYSESALIETSSSGLNSLDLIETKFSLGIKNIKAILLIRDFKTININACHFIGNFLNVRSSLFILSFCENCRIYIGASIITNNKAYFGGFICFEFLLNRRLNTSNTVGYLTLYNNTIKKNAATVSGGLLYVNASNFQMDQDFTFAIIQLIDNSFVLKELNRIELDFSGRAGNLFFFEAEYSLIDSIKHSLDLLNAHAKEKFKNFFADVRIGTLVTAFEVFTVSPILQPVSGSTIIYSPQKVVHQKDMLSNFYFCIVLFDGFDQVVLPSATEDLSTSSNKSTISNPLLKLVGGEDNIFQVSITFQDGLFCANKFFLDGDIVPMMGELFNISITPGDVKEFVPSLNQDIDSEFKFVFRVFECREGEMYKDNICAPCPRNSYFKEKIIGSLTKCILCLDSDDFNCYGGDMRSPKVHFWRMSEASENFLRCPTSSCLGDPYFEKNFTENDCLNCYLPGSGKELLYYSYNDNLTSIGICNEGYTGNLCSQCVEGYGTSGRYKCVDCNSSGTYVKQVLVAIAKMVLFYIFIWISIKTNTSAVNDDRESSTFIKNVLSSYLINIFFIYMGVINVLKNLPLELTDVFEEILRVTANLSSTEDFEIFSSECILKKLGNEISPVFFNVLASIVFFSFSVIILIFMFTVQIKSIKRKTGGSLFSNIKGIILIFFSNNLIMFLGPKFAVLFCLNIGDDYIDNSYVMSDLGHRCNDFQHNLFRYIISLPIILFFGLLIPCVIIYNLLRVKKDLTLISDKLFILTYGYFISPYRTKVIFFEIIVLFHKIFLIIFKEIFIFLILQNRETLATNMFFCYLIIFYNIHSYLAPYELKNYSTLYKVEMIAIKISMSNALAASIWTLIKNDKKNPFFLILLLGGYLIITNSIFVIYWFLTFFNSTKEKLKDTKDWMLSALSSKAAKIFESKLMKRTSLFVNSFFKNGSNNSFHSNREISPSKNIESPSKKPRKKLLPQNVRKESLINTNKSLLKENKQMKILVKLLIKQLESKAEEAKDALLKSDKDIFLKSDSGRPNNIAKYHNSIQLMRDLTESKDVFIDMDEGKPNSLRNYQKDSQIRKAIPEKNSKSPEPIPTKEAEIEVEKGTIFDRKPVDIVNPKRAKSSCEVMSKKLKGSQYTDYFLQFKYRLIEVRQLAKSSFEKKFTRILSFTDSCMNLKANPNKEWISTIIYSDDRDDIFYVAVRKLNPWNVPPLSQSLTIDFKKNLKTITVTCEIHLKDFFKFHGLEIKEAFEEEIDTQRPLISDKIDDDTLKKIFKQSSGMLTKRMFGSLNFECPVLETSETKFYLEFQRSGNFNVYGEFNESFKILLLDSIKECLRSRDL